MTGVLVGVLAASLVQTGSSDRWSLQQAIRYGLTHSPALQASEAEVRMSRAESALASAQLRPLLTASGLASSGNNSGIFSSGPLMQPSGWMLAPTGSFLDGNLSLMVPIYAPKLRASSSESASLAKASGFEWNESKLDFMLKVTELYAQVLARKRMLQADVDRSAYARELVRTTRELYTAGKGVEASVQRVEAELSAAEREQTRTRNEVLKARLELTEVIGADLEHPIEPEEAPAHEIQGTSISGLIKRGLENRGVILAAKARLVAAEHALSSSRAGKSPQLVASIMADATNRSDMGGLSAGVTLSFPIVDGGRIREESEKASAAVARARALLRQAQLMVERDVRSAWVDLETAQSGVRSSKAGLKAAQSAYDVIALRVSVGRSILLEQLDALEMLRRSKADLAQSQFDLSVATARVLRSVGESL